MTTSDNLSASPVSVNADYQKTIRVQAPPDALFDALTTVSGLSSWWTRVTGTGEEGGELRFLFDPPEPCVMHVDLATKPTSVRWTVTSCFLPEWVGTRPIFAITPVDGGASELSFCHHGITPSLECFDMCTNGWSHFLGSLRDYAETGEGSPVGSAADLALRQARSRAGEGARMATVTIGNHAAVRVRLAERDRIRSFYRDVLGCKITRELEGKDDVRIGDGFYIAFLYQSGEGRSADEGVVYASEDSLSDDQFLKSTWLEIKSADVVAMRNKIVSSGVKVLPVPDDHLYFQAPGGQVFRLVGIDEDLSKYEGTAQN
jgi:uncharacterized protein YndB with AHSA1/START domain/catechol 2,3-dioxygenase-like lactoylglutathione lyase family enzyme